MSRLAEFIYSRAWAMREDLIEPLTDIVTRHLAGEKLSKEDIQARIGSDKKARSGYQVVGSTAIIPIMGVISKRASWVHDVSPGVGTSTQRISEDIKAAIADRAVADIAFEIDSPGGSVDGVPELADQIFELRGTKPMTAYVSGMMASAAYWIGSAADKIVATKASQIGSIGVYALVRDFSVAEHNRGVKNTLIRAGRYKAAGHPAKAMTDEDRQVIQEEITDYFEMFVAAVQKHRGMSDEQVRAVAIGRTFIASKAAENGLIDEIGDMTAILGSSEGAVRVNQPAGTEPEAAEKQEESGMDYSKITLEVLEKECPDLVTSIQNKAREGYVAASEIAQPEDAEKAKSDAVTAERARVCGIVAKGAVKEYAAAGVADIVQDAVNNGLSVAEAEGKMKDRALRQLQGLDNPSPGASHDDDPQPEEPKTHEDHLKLARAYKEEHKCTMQEALQKTAAKRRR